MCAVENQAHMFHSDAVRARLNIYLFDSQQHQIEHHQIIEAKITVCLFEFLWNIISLFFKLILVTRISNVSGSAPLITWRLQHPTWWKYFSTSMDFTKNSKFWTDKESRLSNLFLHRLTEMIPSFWFTASRMKNLSTFYFLMPCHLRFYQWTHPVLVKMIGGNYLTN